MGYWGFKAAMCSITVLPTHEPRHLLAAAQQCVWPWELAGLGWLWQMLFAPGSCRSVSAVALLCPTADVLDGGMMILFMWQGLELTASDWRPVCATISTVWTGLAQSMPDVARRSFGFD